MLSVAVISSEVVGTFQSIASRQINHAPARRRPIRPEIAVWDAGGYDVPSPWQHVLLLPVPTQTLAVLGP